MDGLEDLGDEVDFVGDSEEVVEGVIRRIKNLDGAVEKLDGHKVSTASFSFSILRWVDLMPLVWDF